MLIITYLYDENKIQFKSETLYNLFSVIVNNMDNLHWTSQRCHFVIFNFKLGNIFDKDSIFFCSTHEIRLAVSLIHLPVIFGILNTRVTANTFFSKVNNLWHNYLFITRNNLSALRTRFSTAKVTRSPFTAWSVFAPST